MMMNSNPSSRSAMSFIKTVIITALTALTLAPLAGAHSWIEEYQVIDANGSYIGDRGFSRGYMARTDPGYNGFSMDYLVPQMGVRINSSDMLCHPAQRTSNYSNPAYPQLQVQAGGYVAMKYLENGHVTLPWNQLGKPETAGTVFVYGTTQPSDTEMIADVLAWTTDGKGGNGKGFLLTAQNFDDGRCHQINCGNISTDRQLLFPAHVAGQPTSSVEQWCETDLQIPASQPIGKLTTYWVWQWPTAPNADCTYPDGKDEYYTTCADFNIIAAGSGADAKIAAEPDTHTLAQEAPQTTAVSDFMSRFAYTTSPEVIVADGTQTSGQTATATSGFMSACSAGQTTRPIVDIPASCDPISIFSGAAVTSAAQAVKAFATTAQPTAAAASPSAAAPSADSASSTAQMTSAAATSSAAAPPSQSVTLASASPAPEVSTITTLVTSVITLTTSAVTETTYAVVSNSSLSTIASITASLAETSSVLPLPTFSTTTSIVAASAAAPSMSSSILAPPPAAPSMPGSLLAPPPAAASDSMTFSTISTVTAPMSETSAVLPLPSLSMTTSVVAPSAAAPTVGADGMVEDVVESPDNRIASEHAARHAHAKRRHGRHFFG